MAEVEHFEHAIYLDIFFYDLSIILFSITYGILILFLYKQRERTEEVTRPFLVSLIVYFVFELLGTIIQHLFRRETNFNTKTNVPNYDLLVLINLIGLLLVLLGPIWLIHILEDTFSEKKLIKEKHLITWLQIGILTILTICVFIFSYTYYNISYSAEILDNILLLTIFLYLGLLLLQVSVFFGGFLYFSIKSSEKLRMYSLFIALGYFFRIILNIYAQGLANDLDAGILSIPTSYFFIFQGVINLLHILGLIMMFYGFLKLYSLEEVKVRTEEAMALVEKFIRPKKITTEEITFNRQQKICLVCKGRASEFNIFICSECDALYCRKCAKRLINLENACWACSRAIDKSKPSTPFIESEAGLQPIKKTKGLKIFSNQKTIRHIFGDEITSEELRSLGEMKLTIILSNLLNEIKRFGMNQKDRIKFLKELLYFSPDERELILSEISEKMTLELEGKEQKG